MRYYTSFVYSTICRLIVSVLIVISLSSCGEMSRESRIKSFDELRNLKKIALCNCSINSEYTIGSGEDQKSKKNFSAVKTFGTLQLYFLYNLFKTKTSPSILDLDLMIQLKKYRELKFESSYLRENKGVLSWLSKEPEFVSPIDGFGAINLSPANAGKLCEALGVNAILSIEAGYNLDSEANIPFTKPNWWANCKIESALFSSGGELIWKYDFDAKSPLKQKAQESTNILIYSSSSISGEQSFELVKSVAELSSKKLIDTLYADLDFSKKSQTLSSR